ncbi:unnamed protein product [Paramecium sonneborni]|uniref:Uncharacterized protein n=1 Tax=Paramecium sonneborni TaxID=65129 RepID=A0A8S1RTE4_9CILI|nr:unnamed protein product [Paramecium sonneborni]
MQSCDWKLEVQQVLEHPQNYLLSLILQLIYFEIEKEIVLVLEYCSHEQLNTLQYLQPMKDFRKEQQFSIFNKQVLLYFTYTNKVLYKEIWNLIILSQVLDKKSQLIYLFCIFSR